jgi:sigma-B regulation protein RsbU (phosphoserine phosphatase)
MHYQEVLHKSFPVEMSAMKPLRELLKTTLHKASVDQKRIQEVLLAVSEWWADLIEHVNPTPDDVQVIVLVAKHDVVLKILDNGKPFIEFDRYLHMMQLKHTDPNQISESGHGLFIIKEYFPYVEYQVKNAENTHNTLTLPLYHRYCKTTPLIALIEDSSDLRKQIKDFLEEDYAVSTFSKAEDFLASIAEARYALIISDIHMPGMNGIALRKALAKNRETDIIPFIFITCTDDEALEHEAGSLGIDDFLYKPVTKRQLLSAVRRVLKRKASERSVLGALLDEQVTKILHPSLPHHVVGKFHCETDYRTASAGGGDFLLHVSHNDKDYLLLADVMGHGIDAKFFAHVYAGYMRGLLHSIQSASSLAQMMQLLSKLIFADPALECVIATAIGLCFDQQRPGHIEIVNAGHPCPLLLNHQGVETLQVKGPLLGLEATAHYDTYQCKLENDQRLLLFTDGLFEVGDSPQQHQANKQQLLTTLQEHHQQSITACLNHLMAQFDKLAGIPAHDDVTVVLIESLQNGN